MTEHHKSPSLGGYVAVFATLLFCTGLTVWVAFIDLGPFNNIVAIGIAAFKASIVALFFMHVRYSSRLVWLLAGAGVVFLMIMFAFTMADYVSRSWLGMSTSLFLR